jgi:hypothetical protein
MRSGLVTLVLFIGVGCREGGLSTADAQLEAPAALEVGAGFVGWPRSASLQLSNRGPAPLTVQVRVAAPFSTSVREVQVPGGTSAGLTLSFVSASPGRFAAALELEPDQGAPLTVALSAEARGVPDCTPPNVCRKSRFDPDQGCVEEDVDGVACSDGCVTEGQCSRGACFGTAVSCDDHDACTADACSAEGCLHQSVECPSFADPCRVPICDPATGCGSAPAPDGTSCGDNDCVTAHVCIAGACVARGAPEGSQCAQPSACRAESRCVAGACTAPPAQIPTPRWEYLPPPGTHFSQVAADAYGNAFGLLSDDVGGSDDGGVTYSLRLVSLDHNGRQRYLLDLTQATPGLENGVGLMVDSDARKLYLAARTYNYVTAVTHRVVVAQARDAVSGQLLWEHDLTQGIPVLNSSTSERWLDVNRVMELPSGDVAFSLTEGESLHTSYVVALSRQTGAELWRVERSGHIYSQGLTASGELWETSAPCWSDDFRMSRISSAGAEQLRQPSPLQLAAFDGDHALAFQWASNTAPSVLSVLSPSLVSAPVSMPTGHLFDLGSGSLRVGGGALTLSTATYAQRFVDRVELDGGALAWSAPVAAAQDSVDLRLLRGGETAVSVIPPDGGSMELLTLSARGASLARCPYGDRATVAVTNGFLVTRGASWNSLASFDVPGLDTERTGWPAPGGVDGASRAR